MTGPVPSDAAGNLRIVGFDLGHADTALALVQDPRRDEVTKLPLPSAGPRIHVSVTAVAEHPERGILLGLFAINQGEAPLHMTFKDSGFDEETVRRPTIRFVQGIKADLEKRGHLPEGQSTRWVFGVPSGWGEPTQKVFRDVLREAGLVDVEVVPESRAALLFARDSGQIRVDPTGPARNGGRHRTIPGTALVADLGSSTLDFTLVTGRRATTLRDSGTRLGASLIDMTIMDWFRQESPQRDSLERWLEWDLDERKRFQFACRTVKEDYFAHDHPTASTVMGSVFYTPLHGDPNVDFFPIRISPPIMERVLETPQPTLGGKGWRDAFRDDLQAVAVVANRNTPPELVVLTGGASRMRFVFEIAQEIFGPERVVMGDEPELAIARGLALAGRIGVRAGGFRIDIADFLRTDQVKTVVDNRLPDLATAIGTAVATGVVETYALPAFRRWRSGRITTLAEMETEVADKVSAGMRNPSNQKVNDAVREWQDGLRPDLAELTGPICRRWGIPPSAMELPPLDVRDQEWVPAIGLANLLASKAGSIAAMVATAVVAAVVTAVFAAGLSLGPGGWVALGVGALWSIVMAEEVGTEKVKTADLPQWVRERFKESTVTDGAAQREAQLATSLAAAIRSDEGKAVVTQVTDRLRAELLELAKEAELLIS